MKLKCNLLILIILVTTLTTKAQVTIGSGLKPNTGSLLDLKEYDASTAGGATSTLGMMLPRVELKDATTLKMGDTEIQNNADGGNQYTKHIGLMVFNTNKCILQGKGVYTWDGTTWQNIVSSSFPFTPTLSQTYFDLPSGRDARGAVSEQELTITWENTTKPTWTISKPTNLTLVGLSSPTTSGTLDKSPYVMKIQPTDIGWVNPASPWFSKESRIVFTNLATECGQQTYVTLNQTNYGLVIGNKAGSKSIAVRGNARWKIVKKDPYGVIKSLSATEGGEDLKNGTATYAPNLNYVTNEEQKYNTADIIFMDANPVKRFNDVILSVVSCYNTNEPTIEEWAKRLDYTTEEIAAVTDAQLKSSAIKNGYQLHRDQGTDGKGANGNLFISSDFGTAGRWMITNLAAKSFVSIGRTGDDKNKNMDFGGSMYTVPSGRSVSDSPLWCYPKTPTDATTYNNNPRIGLLYNWAGATNSRGRYSIKGVQLNTTGQASINEGEGDQYPQSAKIQGACPNGWHMPSDREWTDLEQYISNNTSKYAASPVLNENIAIGTSYGRSVALASAMKDPCPAPNQTVYNTALTNGKSNVMSVNNLGGLNIMLVGYAFDSKTGYYGYSGDLWSSSGNLTTGAWYRQVKVASETTFGVGRNVVSRVNLLSVRCKQD